MLCGSPMNHREKHVKHTHPQFKLRLLPEVKLWLEEAAEKSHRSISGQINFLLTECMEKEKEENNSDGK
ncbi:Arc family DNA-binding protein [Acetobacter ghanensis]|uniref:Arc family DNA-binding protein n=1 Tax=Acetobacter ghanensis TaxID=431306 RepID=UPI003D327B4D